MQGDSAGKVTESEAKAGGAEPSLCPAAKVEPSSVVGGQGRSELMRGVSQKILRLLGQEWFSQLPPE